MFRTFVCAGILACISQEHFAQQQNDSTKVEQLEEVVITDSRFKLKIENSGKVITKIKRQELEALQGKSIAEIINATAGIEINGTRSNAAQNLGYFVRGGRNRQVLIMIDGVALTDPSQIANDYDLRLLNADQVEEIEIMKGAASVLYGTGAATAVINIRLKEASQKPIAATFKSLLGTNQTQEDSRYQLNDFQNSVSINGSLQKFSYLASFGQQYTDGISAVENGSEDDAFNSQNLYLKMGYKVSDHFKIGTYASADRFKADFDDSFGFQDADNQSETQQERLGLTSEFRYGSGSLTLNGAYNQSKRSVSSSFPAKFNSNSLVADLFNRYVFNEAFHTVVGLNFQKNTMESYSVPFGESDFEKSINDEEASFQIIDPYINTVFVSDFGLNVNAGARFNNHSEYGGHLVYNINPSYSFKTSFGYLKALASYSSAYITPSLYQLFEPSYGTTELQPEENRTIEVGTSVHVTDRFNLSLVYFNRLEENFIDFVDQGGFVYQYQNIDDSFTASGIELVSDLNISETIKIRANGTYTKVEDDLNLRIPKFKCNVALDYKLFDTTFLRLNYQFNDSRNDNFYNNDTFENEQIGLESYSLFDVYVRQQLAEGRMHIFANVTNLFNASYNELYGYTTKGRNVNLGFTLNL